MQTRRHSANLAPEGQNTHLSNRSQYPRGCSVHRLACAAASLPLRPRCRSAAPPHLGVKTTLHERARNAAVTHLPSVSNAYLAPEGQNTHLSNRSQYPRGCSVHRLACAAASLPLRPRCRSAAPPHLGVKTTLAERTRNAAVTHLPSVSSAFSLPSPLPSPLPSSPPPQTPPTPPPNTPTS